MGGVLLVINLIVVSLSFVTAENNRTFPDEFLFGVASSAYQVEGAWDTDGKGENIWDRWIHKDPSRIENNDTADVACNSYYKYKEDVANAAYLQATHYKFSISWARILPNGLNTSVNAKGIMYYQALIEEILRYNMTPVVTLYHYDLPQALQDLGGWVIPKMVDFFAEYARVAFRFFPDIKYWITFNKPKSICRLGYGTGARAPGITLDGIGDYLCAYVLLKSHAEVYRLYKTEFPHLEGKVSIAIEFEWAEPASTEQQDKDAAERRLSFEFGLYAHPIFIGNWPQVVIDRVGNRSLHEHFDTSRLPAFTPEDIDYIQGTADFMTIETYHTNIVANVEEPEYGDPSYLKDMKTLGFPDSDSQQNSTGISMLPWGLRKTLSWLKRNYDDPEIFISGAGVSDDGSTLDDCERVDFFSKYLSSLLDAMYEDNVTVFGFTVWSLMDNFDWTSGYSRHFGLYHVDFSNPNRTRKAKNSVYFFRELAETRQLPEDPISSTILPSTTTKGGNGNRVAHYPLLILIGIYFCFIIDRLQ